MTTLKTVSTRAVLRVTSLGTLAVSLAGACSTEPARSPHNLELRTAPLNLEGIDFACYDILVENGVGDPVVALGDPTTDLLSTTPDTKTICSTQYGNGDGGAITYIAPCDASEPAHFVTLWVDGLYTGTPANPTAVPFQDPCPNGCILPATCAPNADTPVEFNLTIMRPANQGFFDVAVNFDDIFCSAKVDCEYAPGDPIDLLHHPDTGARDQTVVLGLACTAGPGATNDTVLFRDPIVITCARADPIVLDPTLGDGKIYGPVMADPDLTDPVWQYAIYSGTEDLDCGSLPCNKRYWNVAIGFDSTANGCSLTTTTTASSGVAMPGFTTPDASTYPLIEVDVDLTGPTGGLVCSQHPLNGTSSGVRTAYTSVSTAETFCHRLDGSGLASQDCITVLSLNDLRGLTAPFSDEVLVHHHSSPAAGGGGTFRWDPTATTDDNDGTVVMPTGWVGPGRWLRQYTGPIQTSWFGARRDGATDDCLALQAAIDTGEDVDFDPGTYLVGCRLSFSVSNATYDGQGAATLLFGMDHTERLADISGDDLRWKGLTFSGNSRQVWGALLYIADGAARPSFEGCVFRDIAGTQQGSGSSPRYNQYGVLISPYGVEDFAFIGCEFRNITNDNSGAHAPPLEGGGFAGGVFFLREDFQEPNDPQPTPTSGVFSGCHFEDIRTILASGLNRAQATTYDDADGIRFYGSEAGANLLPVLVENSSFRNISKRAVKGSLAAGQTLSNLTVDVTNLPYPMVTAVKIGQGMTVDTLNVTTTPGQPVDTLFQIHNSSGVTVRNVVADHASYVWNFAPLGSTYTMTDLLVSNLTVNNLYIAGFNASGVLAGGQNLRFEDISLNAAAGAETVVGFLGPITAPSGQTGITLARVSLTNMDLKLEGIDLTVNDVTLTVNRQTFAGSSPTRALVEIGTTPGTGETTNSVSNLVVDGNGLNDGYLSASRDFGIIALFGDGAVYNDLELNVPDGLSVSFPHLNIYGSRVTSDGFLYRGRGYNFVSTTAGEVFGPYVDVTIRNWTRTAVNPATTALTRFIYLNAGQSNVISDVLDNLVGAGPTIDINGGTVAPGETFAYFISNVGSRTTSQTIVQHGGLASLTNIFYLP